MEKSFQTTQQQKSYLVQGIIRSKNNKYDDHRNIQQYYLQEEKEEKKFLQIFSLVKLLFCLLFSLYCLSCSCNVELYIKKNRIKVSFFSQAPLFFLWKFFLIIFSLVSMFCLLSVFFYKCCYLF